MDEEYLEFFKGRNTKGNNRTFGIGGYISYLVRKCEQEEINISHPAT